MNALFVVMMGCFFLTQCACNRDRKPEREPEPNPHIDQVEQLSTELQARAAAIADEQTGWIDLGCDAAEWEGRRRAGETGESDALLLAEYPDEPGRFARRPVSQPCWTPEAGDVGSASTWSRDMGIAGLLPWAWLHKRRDVVERHQAYGRAHSLIFEGFPAWKMGEPFADGRTVYTPAMIGTVAQVVYALGGADSGQRRWDNFYPAGLDDYQANLQVSDIWLRGEISHELEAWADCPDKNGAEGSISKTMFDRLVEHAKQEPGDPFYQAVLGKYTGDMEPAISALLAGTVGGYVRCSEPERCAVANRLFAARIVLRQFGRG